MISARPRRRPQTSSTEPVEDLLDSHPPEADEPVGTESVHFSRLWSGSPAIRDAKPTAPPRPFTTGPGAITCTTTSSTCSSTSWDNPLLCDVGYPEQTDAFNRRRFGIWTNTICHNTVMVDATRMGRGPAKLHAFEPNGFAQVVDASAEPPTRTSQPLPPGGDAGGGLARHRAMSSTSSTSAAASSTTASLMGPQADFVCEPALGPVQEQGTLAGADVPYEQFYDDPGLRTSRSARAAYSGYRGSGFQFFCQCAAGAAAGPGRRGMEADRARPGRTGAALAGHRGAGAPGRARTRRSSPATASRSATSTCPGRSSSCSGGGPARTCSSRFRHRLRAVQRPDLDQERRAPPVGT